MVDARRTRIARSRKKNSVPLSNLRTSQVVRAVVNHPRRLAELVGLLDDKCRMVRGRAAVTLARLSETHAGRLVRIVDRLKEGLSDDAASVRWSLIYALGRIGSNFPNQATHLVSELAASMEDENRVVKIFASRAIQRIALRRPRLIRNHFEAKKRPIPSPIAQCLKKAERKCLR